MNSTIKIDYNKTNQLVRQLKEIQEEGSLNTGFNMNIFKDENFDLNYI